MIDPRNITLEAAAEIARPHNQAAIAEHQRDELLRVLKLIADRVETKLRIDIAAGGTGDDWFGILNVVRIAIAKAEGRQP